MKNIAFKMRLKPGTKEEYKRRHQALWPELEQLLIAQGIREYYIYLDEETNSLFAFQRLKGPVNSQDLGQHAIVKKWWDFMADLMETNPDQSPVSHPLEEVFQL